ncbi:MAG TPA: exodeoxyribonuclease VII large subunit, partial [Gemmatimonadaceae bacterium]
ALHDILAVIRRRCPITRVVLVPATVQGSEAPRSVRIALERVARWNGADLLIVGRGGGGREDLWAFNDERLVRTVASMPMPVISAVGHEVDVTLCDLVADYRAPTPSAAAEAAVPLLSDLVGRVRMLAESLRDAAQQRVERARLTVQSAARAVCESARHHVERRRLRVEAATGRLHALSPLATMTRGYAAISDTAGRPITSVTSVTTGATFAVRLADGRVDALAQHVEPIPLGAQEARP